MTKFPNLDYQELLFCVGDLPCGNGGPKTLWTILWGDGAGPKASTAQFD